MLTVNHPGPWHLFLNRPDNKGLHILEVKQKYLHEQLTYENQLSQTVHVQNMLSLQPKGNNTANEFVENEYVEDYFI